MFVYSLFELEISVKFYVIDVIFSERFVIGENVDFSWDFRIYIGIKCFELWVWNWAMWWVKVLILVGFYDIGCDIGIW